MGRILFFIALFGAIFVAWTISRKRNSLDNEERRELERRGRRRGAAHRAPPQRRLIRGSGMPSSRATARTPSLRKVCKGSSIL